MWLEKMNEGGFINSFINSRIFKAQRKQAPPTIHSIRPQLFKLNECLNPRSIHPSIHPSPSIRLYHGNTISASSLSNQSPIKRSNIFNEYLVSIWLDFNNRGSTFSIDPPAMITYLNKNKSNHTLQLKPWLQQYQSSEHSLSKGRRSFPRARFLRIGF